ARQAGFRGIASGAGCLSGPGLVGVAGFVVRAGVRVKGLCAFAGVSPAAIAGWIQSFRAWRSGEWRVLVISLPGRVPMAAASNASSPQSDYIQHHLVHLNNLGEKQTAIADFGVINYDSLFWSILMGLIVVLVLWRAAKSATAGVPGRFQVGVEMLV